MKSSHIIYNSNDDNSDDDDGSNVDDGSNDDDRCT